MSKTALEISISVPLPDDELDRADILHGMKEAIGSFRNSLPEGSDFALRVLKKRPPAAKQSRPERIEPAAAMAIKDGTEVLQYRDALLGCQLS